MAGSTEIPNFIPQSGNVGVSNAEAEADTAVLAEIARLEKTDPLKQRAVEMARAAAPNEDILPQNVPVSEDDMKNVIALMQQQMAALRGELEAVKNTKRAGDLLDENASIGGYPWRYYRLPQNWPDKQSREWVVVAPGGTSPKGEMDAKRYANYLRKGMRTIEGYGFPDVPTTTKGADALMTLLQKGGAKEFPCSQVIAYRWHIAPPIKGFKFPQYETQKANVRKLTCESCGQVNYFMKDDRTAGDSYRRHLTQTHKYPFENAARSVEKAGFEIAAFTEGVQEIDERSNSGVVPTMFTEETVK